MLKLGTLIFSLLALIAIGFLQNNASKLLLAIMESRHDSENAERILYNMRPKELVSPWVVPELPTPFKPCTAALGRQAVFTPEVLREVFALITGNWKTSQGFG